MAGWEKKILQMVESHDQIERVTKHVLSWLVEKIGTSDGWISRPDWESELEINDEASEWLR